MNSPLEPRPTEEAGSARRTEKWAGDSSRYFSKEGTSTINKDVKSEGTSLVIREMQIKRSKIPLIPMRMAIIKKERKENSDDVEKLEPSCIAGGTEKPLGTAWRALQKLHRIPVPRVASEHRKQGSGTYTPMFTATRFMQVRQPRCSSRNGDE